MYKVYCDSYLLFSDNVDEFTIIKPSLSLELNKVGSFTFTIYPNHPYYSQIQKLKSIITVYQGDEIIFRGRVLNDEQGWQNEKSIICEGELAFFNDSIIRPYDYQTNGQITIANLFGHFINRHNEQVDANHQFIVGNVTVTDGDTTNTENLISRANADYDSTWSNLIEKLINMLGGYIWVRHEADGNYIDYLADFSTISTQTVEFGKNLLDVVQTVKGEDVITGIIPLGAENEDGEKLTISSVNGGVDYLLNTERANTYGKIFATVEWEDVTEASTLLSKAQSYLTSIGMLTKSIDITAVDLATLDSSVNAFHLGRYVRVVDNQHGINSETFLVIKLSIDLLKPENNKLSLGATDKAFTEQTSGAASVVVSLTAKVNGVQQSVISLEYNIDQQIATEIQINADSILQTVSDQYYIKGDVDRTILATKTEFQQKDDEFEFRFNEFQADIDAVASGADANFSEIRKYIRFVDGNIVLGEEGNELVLKIQNDRISFLQNNVEVAYFSDKKLYVTDGEYINSLKIGSYAFMPRANGNLSLKKVN